jgi:hypothetical protein
MELMELCFAMEWTGASLIEVKREREGDTSAAERGLDIRSFKK